MPLSNPWGFLDINPLGSEYQNICNFQHKIGYNSACILFCGEQCSMEPDPRRPER